MLPNRAAVSFGYAAPAAARFTGSQDAWASLAAQTSTATLIMSPMADSTVGRPQDLRATR